MRWTARKGTMSASRVSLASRRRGSGFEVVVRGRTHTYGIVSMYHTATVHSSTPNGRVVNGPHRRELLSPKSEACTWPFCRSPRFLASCRSFRLSVPSSPSVPAPHCSLRRRRTLQLGDEGLPTLLRLARHSNPRGYLVLSTSLQLPGRIDLLARVAGSGVSGSLVGRVQR